MASSRFNITFCKEDSDEILVRSNQSTCEVHEWPQGFTKFMIEVVHDEDYVRTNSEFSESDVTSQDSDEYDDDEEDFEALDENK